MSMNMKAKVNFNKEINNMIDQMVRVELNDETRFYSGELVGYDLSSNALCLAHVSNENKEKFTKIILHGNSWSKIFLTTPLFPMKDLSDFIGKNFPAGQVKFDQDSNTINILNGKIIVTDAGVEGTGPTAARVSKMYQEFMESYRE